MEMAVSIHRYSPQTMHVTASNMKQSRQAGNSHVFAQRFLAGHCVLLRGGKV